MQQGNGAYNQRLLDLAQELIRIPSVAGRENQLIEKVAEELRGVGFTVQYQAVLGAGGPNLVASRGSGGPWFVTHADVYPAYEHPDPFRPRIENEGWLVGRGAVDTKGQIAALLYSLQCTSQPANVSIVVDEERLGRGSEMLRVPLDSEGAVVLEPTNLHLGVAEAGSIELEVSITGRPVHGSIPWKGLSAIDLAFEQYQRLCNLSFTGHKHPLFELGGWINLGRINGGNDTMVVPSRCLMEMEVGYTPGLSAQEVAKQVYEALDEAESVHMADIWEPWESDLNSDIIKQLKSAYSVSKGSEPKYWGVPSWTDGANIIRKGVSTVVFGAGSLADAHTWHEAMPISEMEDMAKVLTCFIQNW